MASMEGERMMLAQLSSEQKARLDEVIKQAELTFESEEVFNQCIAVVAEKESLDKAKLGIVIPVAGNLSNKTKGRLTTATDLQHQYAGYVSIDYTNPIESGGNGGFSMGGNTDKGGVEAAFVYVGKSASGEECGWLVGFLLNKDTVAVYVLCGPIANFINPNWPDIKTKIERAGYMGFYNDKQTGIYLCCN